MIRSIFQRTFEYSWGLGSVAPGAGSRKLVLGDNGVLGLVELLLVDLVHVNVPRALLDHAVAPAVDLLLDMVAVLDGRLLCGLLCGIGHGCC